MDDNLLHQFQNTMAHLELSERPFYNAVGLCYSMKDWEGHPTNCSLQQDSHEFVNISFDRLESLLKSTNQKYLIKDTFSAKQCTHMTCSNCGHVKQKIEEYYILSMPVKNFSKLEDSVNAYVDGEVISDFKCDNCDQKVDINKRCSFVDMPNILMIHLQKIVFNFDTLMNEKIADRFEFPTYLDMKNYNIKKITEKYGINDPDIENYSYLEDENFEYRLVGVIIHQGVAEAGHYYSLICTDSKLKENTFESWGETGRFTWTEFNDTNIRSFDFRNNFEDECFGKNPSQVYGSSGFGSNSWEDGWQSVSGGSSKSAYVLIYEKKVQKSIRSLLDINFVKQHCKTKKEIEEEIKENQRNYLRSYYTQYDKVSSTEDSDKKDESKMELSSEAEFDNLVSSLECGDITVPRDLFSYLVIPRNSYYYLSQDEKEKVKYIPVEYNKETKECYLNIKANEVQKFIPYRIFKKVWDDNNSFSSERQLNNIDFFQFFHNTLQKENIVEQQDNQEKLSLLYELCHQMIFSMLVYAFSNSSITEVSDVFKKVLLLSDEAIVKFSDFILEDNGSELIRILFKCSDAQVRDAVSSILSTAVNRMFDRVDLVEKAEKFMGIMIATIQTEAAANWTKFEHFFNLIKTVAIGGDAQLQFMKYHQLETVLADFFLAERSPIRPQDEKRI